MNGDRRSNSYERRDDPNIVRRNVLAVADLRILPAARNARRIHAKRRRLKILDGDLSPEKARIGGGGVVDAGEVGGLDALAPEPAFESASSIPPVSKVRSTG